MIISFWGSILGVPELWEIPISMFIIEEPDANPTTRYSIFGFRRMKHTTDDRYIKLRFV